MFRRLFPNLAKLDGDQLMSLALLVPIGLTAIGVVCTHISVAMGWSETFTDEPEIFCTGKVVVGEWPECYRYVD